MYLSLILGKRKEFPKWKRTLGLKSLPSPFLSGPHCGPAPTPSPPPFPYRIGSPLAQAHARALLFSRMGQPSLRSPSSSPLAPTNATAPPISIIVYPVATTLTPRHPMPSRARCLASASPAPKRIRLRTLWTPSNLCNIPSLPRGSAWPADRCHRHGCAMVPASPQPSSDKHEL